MSTSRLSTPVLEFSQPLSTTDGALRDALDALRAAIGHVTPLADLVFLQNHAGLSVTAVAAPGTSLKPQLALNHSEFAAGEVRLQVHGGGACTVQLYDVTNSKVVASLTLTATNQLYDSGWITLPAIDVGRERTLEARIVGDGVTAQTLHGIRAQLRTTRFIP